MSIVKTSRIKIDRAIKKANTFKGPQTIKDVLQQIPQSFSDSLTSTQLATVIETVSRAYKLGQCASGAEVIDTNAVWLDSANRIVEWSYDANGAPCNPRFY